MNSLFFTNLYVSLIALDFNEYVHVFKKHRIIASKAIIKVKNVCIT